MKLKDLPNSKKYRVFLTLNGNPDGWVDVEADDKTEAQENAIDQCERNNWNHGDIHKIELK